MIKKIVLSFIIVSFVTINLYSQDAKKNVEKDFRTYLGHLMNQEFTESVEFLYPELFQDVTKELMIETLEQTFNNPDINISITVPDVHNVGEIRKIDSAYYCKLNYSHYMNMSFNNSDSAITQRDIDTRDNMTLTSLEGTFGVENVSYDASNSSFEILSAKDCYAKSKNGVTNWKFIDVDKNNMMIMNMVLPKQILDEINSEK